MARKMLKKSQLRSIFNISLHFTEIRTSIENLPLTQWSARSITKSIRITPSFFFGIHIFTIHQRQI